MHRLNDIAGVLLLVTGTAMFLFGLLKKFEEPVYRGRFARTGVWLMVVAGILAVATLGIIGARLLIEGSQITPAGLEWGIGSALYALGWAIYMFRQGRAGRQPGTSAGDKGNSPEEVDFAHR